MQTICSVSFLYGPGIPILFPLCLISLCLRYVLERYTITRYFKKPHTFRNQVNIETLNDILLMLYLYPISAFWMYSNKIIFSNEISPIKEMTDTPKVDDHSILNALGRIHIGSFFIILVIVIAC